MAKIILVFTSMTGNTEMMADTIVNSLKETEHEIVVKEIFDNPEASELEEYDGIILGT